MKSYINKLIREYQEVWSVDEMMLNVKGTERMGKGYYSWMWSIIHPQTRFVIAVEIFFCAGLKYLKCNRAFPTGMKIISYFDDCQF